MDQTTVTIVSAVGIFVALFGFWWKIDAKIEKVREASETAHNGINAKLGNIETTLATHSERFNTVQAQIKCVDDKVDKLHTG